MMQNHTVHWLDSPEPADLHLLMILWYRCCTIRSSAGVSKISKFFVQDFLNSPAAETGFISLAVVSLLKLKIKLAMR
jgi:hypothetical protein